MRTGQIICFALVALSLVIMLLSGNMGTHEATFSLPNGDLLTIEQANLEDAYLNGQLIEPQVTDDYRVAFWSSYASAIIFALAVLPIGYFGDKTKAK